VDAPIIAVGIARETGEAQRCQSILERWIGRELGLRCFRAGVEWVTVELGTKILIAGRAVLLDARRLIEPLMPSLQTQYLVLM
jgi:hypothetical protein